MIASRRDSPYDTQAGASPDGSFPSNGCHRHYTKHYWPGQRAGPIWRHDPGVSNFSLRMLASARSARVLNNSCQRPVVVTLSARARTSGVQVPRTSGVQVPRTSGVQVPQKYGVQAKGLNCRKQRFFPSAANEVAKWCPGALGCLNESIIPTNDVASKFLDHMNGASSAMELLRMTIGVFRRSRRARLLQHSDNVRLPPQQRCCDIGRIPVICFL